MLANQTISATYTKCRKTPCAQCYSLVSRHTTIDFSLCFAFAVVCLFRHAVYTKVEMRNNNEKKIPSIPFKIYFSMVERKKKIVFFLSRIYLNICKLICATQRGSRDVKFVLTKIGFPSSLLRCINIEPINRVQERKRKRNIENI